MFERSEVNPWPMKQSTREKTVNKGERQYKVTQRTIIMHEERPQLNDFQQNSIQQVLQSHYHMPMVQDGNRIKVTTYNRPKQPWWNILPCCKDVQVQQQFEDCGICHRRVYNHKELQREEEPYVSAHRMKARQKQPINVFYDQISNNQLLKDHWGL